MAGSFRKLALCWGGWGRSSHPAWLASFLCSGQEIAPPVLASHLRYLSCWFLEFPGGWTNTYPSPLLGRYLEQADELLSCFLRNGTSMTWGFLLILLRACCWALVNPALFLCYFFHTVHCPEQIGPAPGNLFLAQPGHYGVWVVGSEGALA